MEMIELVTPFDAHTQALERLGFLAQLYRLPSLAVEILGLVAGLRLDEPIPPSGGWCAFSLANRLCVPDDVLAAELTPGSPLVEFGLLRTVAPSVTLNLRIERYLLGPPRV